LGLALELGMGALIARCNASLAAVYARTEQFDAMERHFAVAQTMYRAMEMRFWLDKLETDVAPARLPRRTGHLRGANQDARSRLAVSAASVPDTGTDQDS